MAVSFAPLQYLFIYLFCSFMFITTPERGLTGLLHLQALFMCSGQILSAGPVPSAMRDTSLCC